jgi:putative oxidoreductase
MKRFSNIGWHIGRTGLASLFILGGINKLANPDTTIAMMNEAGLPAASILLPLVIGLELGGGLWVSVGKWRATIPALALAVFTLTTNALFHDFWTLSGEIQALQLSLFFKNLAIASGLIAIAAILARGPSNDRA